MRTLVIVMCALAIGGCANKRPDAAVDRYINQELAPHLAKILAARAWLRRHQGGRRREPRQPGEPDPPAHRCCAAVTQAADGLSKLTPPPSIEYLHAGLLDIAKEEQAAVADMSAALAPVDVAKFKAGHDRLMSIQERVVAWEGKLDTALREHAVTMKPLPDVDIPKPREQAPTPPAAAGFAAPCDPATKVVTGGAVVECTLTEGYELCGAGKATFHPNGKPKTCTSEMMFAPPETEAGTPKDQVVLCGPGELTRGADGVVEACTLASDMVGTTRVGKGAKVTLGAKAKVTQVILGDGLVIKP